MAGAAVPDRGDRGGGTGLARGAARASSQLRAEMVAARRDRVCAGIASWPDREVAEGGNPASGRRWDYCAGSGVIGRGIVAFEGWLFPLYGQRVSRASRGTDWWDWGLSSEIIRGLRRRVGLGSVSWLRSAGRCRVF